MMVRPEGICSLIERDPITAALSVAPLLGALLLSFILPFSPRSVDRVSGATGITLSPKEDQLVTFEEYPAAPGKPIRFLARTEFYSALLDPRGAHVRIADRHGRARSLKMRFVGSDGNARSESRHLLPGKVNYLVGNDPALWRTGLSRFGRVAFQDVYPGIDLHYYGAGNRLEYDFVLHTGADPDQLLLEFEGVDGLSIDAAGSLNLALGPETLRLLPPDVYQEEDQVREPIPAGYEMAEARTVRFRLGEYDRDRDLVIDPILVYSTVLGGSSGESLAVIATDSDGNAYVAGQTASANFPLVDPAKGEIGGTDGFITKFDPAGAIIFSTFVGGAAEDRLQDIALDGNSNIYLTGFTESVDFPVQDAHQNAKAGRSDAFVSKLTPTGDAFVFSTYLGGLQNEHIRSNEQLGAIATDASGSCYVLGATESFDFPVLNPFQAQGNNLSNDSNDAFVAKFDAVGDLVYSSFYGGSEVELPTDIAVDNAGSAYLVGGTDSADLPLQNALRETRGGNFCRSDGFGDTETCEGFAAKVSPSGASLIYSTYLGGEGDIELVGGVVVDETGTAHLIGHTSSEDFPSIPSAAGHGGFTRSTLSGETDLFLASLTSDGGALTYAAFLGGEEEELSSRLSIDDAGNWCFAGSTRSPEFPVFSPIQGVMNGSQDVVISCFNPATAEVRLSTFLGGTGGTERAHDIAVEGDTVYTTGTLFGTRGFAQVNPVPGGGIRDAFVTSLAFAPGPFLGPLPDQSWTRFVLVDTKQNGRPDPQDEILFVGRRGDDIELSSGRWGRAVLELSTGNSPELSGLPVQLDSFENTRFKVRDGETVATSRWSGAVSAFKGERVTSLDLAFERFRRRPGVRQGQVSLIDSDGNGVFDAIRGQGDGYPQVTVSLQGIDINGDGAADFISIPWSLAHLAGTNVTDQFADPQIFIPLGDSDDDGIPDSIVPDFDNNGLADPDLPRLAPLAGPEPKDLYSLYFAQFGEGGGILFSQIILFSPELEPGGGVQPLNQETNATIVLKDGLGNPLQTDLNGEQINGELQIVIPPGGLRTFSTDGLGPVVGGSVTVTSDRPVAGVILFGGSVGLAGVGSSSELGMGFLAPMESRLAEEIRTGIAIMNLESAQVTLVLRLLDQSGQELASDQLLLPSFGQKASFIDELFGNLDLSNFAGVLRVETDGRITATVVQSRPGEFATMPVTPLRGGSPKLDFAQFGEGDGILFSQFQVINMDEQEAGRAQIIIRNDDGNSLTTDLNGEEFTGFSDVFEVSPQGLSILSTDGEGPLVSGSAEVAAAGQGRYAGVLLFGGSVGLAGVGESMRLSEGFVAPLEIDQSRQVNTGVAIRNLETSRAAILEARLYGPDGDLLARDNTQSLPRRGHLSLFVDQFAWVPEDGVVLDLSRFEGTIRVTSELGMVATVIQTRPGQFATMPVSVLSE